MITVAISFHKVMKAISWMNAISLNCIDLIDLFILTCKFIFLL